MSQELYTFTGVMCPQCKRLRNVTFKAKARTNGDLLLGLPSIDSRKVLKEHLKKLCSICDGSYTAKDELACRIGTRLHSALDAYRPEPAKERYLTGWDKTLEGINNRSISAESALQIAGLNEAPHYQGVDGCGCVKCVESAYSMAMIRCGLGFYTPVEQETIISQPQEYMLWSQTRLPKKQSKHQEE